MDVEEPETKKESLIRGEIAAKQYTEKILNHNGIKLDSLRLKGFEVIKKISCFNTIFDPKYVEF